MTVVNALGLSCPQPLMLVMEALKNEPGSFVVLVDSESALESVLRAVKKEKRTTEEARAGSEITINIGPK